MVHERVRACVAVGLTLGLSQISTVAQVADPSGRAAKRCARVWGRQMVERLGIDLHVTGYDGVDFSRPVVVMANHNSHLDIPVLFSAIPDVLGVLAKESLFRFPFFGRAMRGIGCVPIARDDKHNARAAIRRAADQVRAGSSILVFPEGTRGRGDGVRPFKAGAFHLVQAARVPIVPVGIRGTAAVCPRDAFTVFPGRVDVAIGAPIVLEGRPEEGARERAALTAEVRHRIAELAGMPLVAA